ncbi:8080_t:CDS:2, partial [Dentiscutata erythropus]
KQKRAEAERKSNLKIRNGFNVLYKVLPHHLARNKMSKADLLQKAAVHLKNQTHRESFHINEIYRLTKELDQKKT